MSLSKIALALGTVATLQFTGCLVNESKTDPIDISASLSTSTLKPGDSLKVTGTIKAPGNLKITVDVIDPSGKSAIGTGQILRKLNDSLSTKDEIDLSKYLTLTTKKSLSEFLINGKGYTCAGEYKIKIEGGISEGDQVKGYSSKEIPFTVNGPTCDDSLKLVADLKVATDTVAGWGSTTYGSTLDLDEGKSYKEAAAKEVSGNMDLFFNTFSAVTSTSMSAFHIEAAAKSVEKVDGWETKNKTLFYNSGLSAANFEKIRSSYIIESLWKESSADADGILSINASDVIIAKSDKGKVTLVHIVGKSGDDPDDFVAVQTLVKK